MRKEIIGDCELYLGDCMEVMPTIIDIKVDMILCDLPYGTTNCKWDTIIPFNVLWKNYDNLIKNNNAIVLFGSEPFSSNLRLSNIDNYRYDWIWNKRFGANFAVAKIQPIKIHETISVFSKHKSPPYYPQMIKRDEPIKIGKNSKNNSDRGILCVNSLNNPDYDEKTYDYKYPESIQLFNIREDKERHHPTQKPIALMEYLIRTYSKEGEIILDNCMGSGTTGVACINTNRKFIGIEKEPEYFNIACKRIEEATKQKDLFI